MSTSMYMSLPQDIMELLVDALALEDTRSVKDLSLVCHILLPYCRKHLFEAISLPKLRQRNKTAKGLWELLSGAPELVRHIHTIVYVFDTEPPPDVLIHVVPQQLTKLRFLHLSHNFNYDSTIWDETPHRLALLSLLHLPTVTHLKLDSINNFFLSDLAPCVGLKHLEITSIHFQLGPDPLMLPLKAITIDRFSVAKQDSESLRTLSSSELAGKPILDLTALKTLFMRFEPNQGLPDALEVFRGAQHLVEVEIDLWLLYPPWDGLHEIFVGSLETLKYLKFHVFISDDTTHEDPIPGLCDELEQLRNCNVIESIEIFITAHFIPKFDRADKWGTLDGTLSNAGWPALKFVSLSIAVTDFAYFRNSGTGEGLLRLRETHFARLASSSTIRFLLDIDL